MLFLHLKVQVIRPEKVTNNAGPRRNSCTMGYYICNIFYRCQRIIVQVRLVQRHELHMQNRRLLLHNDLPHKTGGHSTFL